MVGPSGIGKTFAMKTFSAAASQILPSVVSIYISLNCTLADASPLATKSLMVVLNDELGRVGARVDPSGGLLGAQIVRNLTEKGLFVQLLVDDLDQLYRANVAVTPLAVQTLHDLSYLGNQPSGRVAIMLCGSSWVLQDLLSSTPREPDNLRAFPLLTTGAIRLDAARFELKRVSAVLPTNLSAVASIVGVDTPIEHMPFLRAVAFLSGCTARMVERLLKDNHYPLSGSSAVVSGEISHLRDRIYVKLLKKDKAVCDRLFKHKTAEQAAMHVLSVDWERRLQPLEYCEVQAIWHKMVRNRVVARDRADLWRCLMQLADMNCIVIDDRAGKVVYPSSLLALATYACEESELILEELAERLYKTAVESAQNGGRHVLHPVGAGARCTGEHVVVKGRTRGRQQQCVVC